MHRLLNYTREDGWRWLLGGVMLVLTNLLTMAVPELFRRAIDGLKASAPTEYLQQLACFLVGVAFIGAICRTASRIIILYAARDIELKVRNAFFTRLTRLDYAFFENHPLGDLMSRATNDLTQVRLMLGPGALNLVNTLVAYAIALPLMARISGSLTLIAFVIYPPASLLLRHLGKVLYRANRRQQEALGRVSSVVQENLAASSMVRAYAIENEQIERFGEVNQTYLHSNIELAWVRSGMFRLSASLASVGTLAVVLLGARRVVAEALSLGEVVALVEYMALLSGPTFALGWVLSLWQRGLASMTRIEEVLTAPSSLDKTSAQDHIPNPLLAQKSQSLVSLSHVSVDFGAGRGLKDVSLQIQRGQTLGIVGPIGGGKSVLLRTLLRLVPIQGGALTICGWDAELLPSTFARQLMAYVPQSATLLNKSLRENVAFGRPDARDDEIMEALGVADFLDDLDRMPEGLDTMIGERGVTLSGGQKQRCAIARALLMKREVLLMDDALSAVDSETESRVLKNLKIHTKEMTVIIVAHRISCVEHADSIAVLDEGQLTGEGTHDALLATNPFYAELVRRQASQNSTTPHEVSA